MAKSDVEEALKASVDHNADEFNRRIRDRQELAKSGTYNPPVDQAKIDAEAREVEHAATPPRALVLDRNREANVRSAEPDIEAEKEAKAKGGSRAKKQSENEERQAAESGGGDARVQARDSPFGQQARAEGEKPQAGNSHRNVAERSELQTETYEAASRAEVETMVPVPNEGVIYKRVWRAIVVRRREYPA